MKRSVCSLSEKSEHLYQHRRFIEGIEPNVADERVALALSMLTRAQRTVVLLCFFEQLNCEEIAKVLATDRQTVYYRLYRAKKRLEKNCGFFEAH